MVTCNVPVVAFYVCWRPMPDCLKSMSSNLQPIDVERQSGSHIFETNGCDDKHN